LLMVTNQSGIGRGLFTMADAERVNEQVQADLAPAGVRFAKIYIAPEAPGQPSRGRKPSPQFLFDARDEFDLNLAESFMVGDKLIDLECGWNAGVKKSILVRTGYGAGVERDDAGQIQRAVIVDGLNEMAEWILNANSKLKIQN
ncbi:MAG TPA: HAD-IIIA family hydrolase, partial [Verrucomicrobiae bacterium]